MDINKNQITSNVNIFIEKEKEGQYFKLPFTVPENTYKIDIKYSYERHKKHFSENSLVSKEEINIIDFALIDVNENHIGSSGSNRNHLFISEYYSSYGFDQVEVKSGEWAVVIGAYKIHEKGVNVNYEFTFTLKQRQLLKGDLHMHTIGSDGKFTVDEVSNIAARNGLDYIFITDHNNYAQNYQIKAREDITVMPGVEWTHYNGHINFLGVKKAYEGSFYTNTLEGMQQKITEAKKNNAIVSVNHPFCPNCGFKFGLENADYDCIEIWNNFMKKSEMDCVNWWHNMLLKGKKIPIVGGSDFHRNSIGEGIGFPMTGLYAMSKSPSDIYSAIRAGNSFVTCSPSGPYVYMELNGKIIGETAVLNNENESNCNIRFSEIKTNDIIKIITDLNEEQIKVDNNYEEFNIIKNVFGNKFVRVELYRSILPETPEMLTLISNPIYIG